MEAGQVIPCFWLCCTLVCVGGGIYTLISHRAQALNRGQGHLWAYRCAADGSSGQHALRQGLEGPFGRGVDGGSG